jgi:hypothetical protein
MAKKVKKAKKANTKKAKKSALKSKPKPKNAAPKAKKAASKRRLPMVAAAAPAAAEELTSVARDVPEDKVAATTEGFMNSGAIKVVKTQQANGKFTLTATFAD